MATTLTCSRNTSLTNSPMLTVRPCPSGLGLISYNDAPEWSDISETSLARMAGPADDLSSSWAYVMADVKGSRGTSWSFTYGCIQFHSVRGFPT